MSLLLAAVTIGAQVLLGWAARDALFLSQFDVSRLPLAIAVSGVVAVIAAILVAGAVTTIGTRVVLVVTLLSGSAVNLLLWTLSHRMPHFAAFTFFVATEVTTAVFFAAHASQLLERYGARGARDWRLQVIVVGLLGVLLGGVVADRIGAAGDAWMALPVIAIVQVLAAIAGWTSKVKFEAQAVASAASARATANRTSPAPGIAASLLAAPRTLIRTRYLHGVVVTMILAASCAVPLDYALKSTAAAHYANGEGLLRFFGWFHAIAACIAFAAQPLFGRILLERAGLGAALTTLPLAVFAGALPALALPGLATTVLARALEFIARRSGFRPAYEVLYIPVPVRWRRGAIALVDVAGERLGETLGAGCVAALIALAPGIGVRPLMALAVGLGAAALVATRRLWLAYVGALEDSLAKRAGEIDTDRVTERTTRAVITSRKAADLRGTWHESSIAIPVDELRRLMRETESKVTAAASLASPASPAVPSQPAAVEAAIATGFAAAEIASPAPLSPVAAARATEELRSGDLDRIRKVLREPGPLDRALAPHVVALLARDDIAAEALEALRRTAPFLTGFLVDVLHDPNEALAVRRRVPRVISADASRRAVEGLLRGLDDPRSEIRLQCGRALARLHVAHSEIVFDRGRVMAHVLEEARHGRRVWESQQQLDRVDDVDDSPLVDEVLRDRANRSLEHVFALLSLVLPLEPLRLAFAGLHTNDEMLRDTALEYLESVLPPHVRGSLWPLLAGRGTAPREPRPAREALADLVGSNQSIQINLAELRRRMQEGA